MSPLIDAKQMRFSWPGGFELSLDSWQVATGERVAICGPSGSGKSTLLSLIAGEVPVRSGELTVAGCALHASNERQRRLHRLQTTGWIFQDYPLVDHLTAHDNVLLPYRVHPALELDAGVRARAHALLNRLDLPSTAHQRCPPALSQGEQQRVAIARALIAQPPLLLADEPTTGLDPARAETLLGLLDSLVEEEGATLLLVSHDPRVLGRFPRVLDLDATGGTS